MSSEHDPASDAVQAMVYQIRVKGHLGNQWADWFGGVNITLEDNGTTLLICPVMDQSALHGLLRKVRDLGMPLISVNQFDPKSANMLDVNAEMDHNRFKKEINMNNLQQTAVIQGNTENTENKMTITPLSLIRWAGLSAVVAGMIFAGIQPIHPADALASVNTSAWAIITPLKTVMCLLFLLGITGLYARQVQKTGWLGLAGYLVFSLCWALELGFIFAEAFIIPPLASAAPQFVEGFFGIVNGHPVQMNLGLLPALYAFMSMTYLLGGLLFGIATLRAGVLPRWAGGLLALTAVLTPLAALLPHAIQRFAAVPVGVAVACLGYTLWSERREKLLEPVAGTGSPKLVQT
jgi:hypothetical protein